MHDETDSFEEALNARADRWVLCLFIAGPTPLSLRAIENLEAACCEELTSGYALKVVDVRRNPEAAAANDLLVAPTLERQQPLPVERIVGDLSDRSRLRAFLRAIGPWRR